MDEAIRAVLAAEQPFAFVQGDAVQKMRSMPESSVDLVLGSPPYADARTYGINAVYTCQQWVDWMLEVTTEAVRICKGLVLWVVAGVQRDSNYWPCCEGLAWEWWKRGNHQWAPCVWWKVDEDDGGTGIPGSGGNVPGKRWLRKDWEYVLCFKKEGNISYDHPEVMGHEPVYSSVGGAMSNQTQDGRRINAGVGERLTNARTKEWGGKFESIGNRATDGRRKRKPGYNAPGSIRRKGGKYKAVERDMPPAPVHDAEGNIVRANGRPFPKIANPGNVLPLIVKARVGGGHMGSNLCHANEAPYPEALAEFFVRSFAAPDSVVLDPFSGSGTTVAVSVRWKRRALGIDLRQSQIELGRRRLAGETPMLFI